MLTLYKHIATPTPQSYHSHPPNNNLTIPILTLNLLAGLVHCAGGTLYCRQHLCVLIRHAVVFGYDLRSYELLGPVPLAEFHDFFEEWIMCVVPIL